MTDASIKDLKPRSLEIFHELVMAYLEDGLPVGSSDGVYDLHDRVRLRQILSIAPRYPLFSSCSFTLLLISSPSFVIHQMGSSIRLLPHSSCDLDSFSGTVQMRLLRNLQRSAPDCLQSLLICLDVSWSRPYSRRSSCHCC